MIFKSIIFNLHYITLLFVLKIFFYCNKHINNLPVPEPKGSTLLIPMPFNMILNSLAPGHILTTFMWYLLQYYPPISSLVFQLAT